MNPEERECPKCKGIMEKGKHMSPHFGVWGKGKPMTTFSSLKGSPTWAYRCSNSGFMEFWSD